MEGRTQKIVSGGTNVSVVQPRDALQWPRSICKLLIALHYIVMPAFLAVQAVFLQLEAKDLTWNF